MFKKIIQKKLLLLITTILFAIFTTIGVITWVNESNMIKSMSHEQANLIIKSIDYNIDFSIDSNNINRLNLLIKQFVGDNYIDEISIHESQNGDIIASSNTNKVGEKGTNKIKEIITQDKILNTESSENGIHIMNMMAPIHDGNNSIIGAVHVKINLTAIDNMVTSMTLRIISIMFIGFIITIIIIYKMINKPLIYLSQKAHLIANGDLRDRKINVSFIGEMGLLAKSFQNMAEQLHTALSVLQESIYKVNEATKYITYSMEQTNLSSKEVSNAAENMTYITSEVADHVLQITNSADDTIKYVDDVLNSTEEVTNLSIDTDKNSKSGKYAMNELSILNDKVSQVSEKVTDKVNKLEKHAQQIYEVVRVIKKISSQTNLLALNAEIEASHAGEGGKGFSVVANEIRKLSIETANNSTQIEEIISGIMSEVKEMVIIEEGLMESLYKERELTKITNNIFNEINNSINILVTKISDSKHKTSNTFGQIKAITDSIHTISAKTQENSGINEGIVASIEELNAQVEMVNENTKHLNKLVSTLEELIRKFSL